VWAGKGRLVSEKGEPLRQPECRGSGGFCSGVTRGEGKPLLKLGLEERE